MSLPLSSAAVVLGGSGAGQVQLGPPGPHSRWAAYRLTVECGGALVPTAKVYLGDADGQLIDGTYTGNFDVADWVSPIVLEPGQYLTVRWTGGSVGANAVARLFGELG